MRIELWYANRKASRDMMFGFDWLAKNAGKDAGIAWCPRCQRLENPGARCENPACGERLEPLQVPAPPNPAHLRTTHVKVHTELEMDAVVTEATMRRIANDLFERFNAGSPRADELALRAVSRLCCHPTNPSSHTSMSVGDVVRFVSDDDCAVLGALFCDTAGWKKL